MTCKTRVWTFVFSSVASYRLLRYVAELAVKGGRTVAYLYTGSDLGFYATVQADAKRIGADSCSLEIELTSSSEQISLPTRSVLDRCHSIWMGVAMRFLEQPHQAKAFRAVYKQRQQVAYRLLKKLCASIVFCSEDGVSSDLSVLSVAKMMKLPVVDIPYGNGTVHELEFDLSRKSDEGRLILAKGLPLLMLKLLAPQWIKGGKFENALMFTPELIFAWESLGISLQDAWIIHGGNCNILCVENEMSYHQYTAEKVPEKKMVQTGSPYCDMIVESAYEKKVSISSLKECRKIDRDRTKILVSWPPSYHETYPDRSEFNSYEEMTKVILGYLNELPGVDLTVSLHPACKDSTRTLLEEIGIDVSDEYLLDLFPQADVFVTYFSSTIRWALATGKIVLNYDAYNIELKTFDSAPGFMNVSQFDEFCSKIKLLVESEVYFSDMKRKQVANAPRWGVLDGECTKRIFDESEKLLVEVHE